MSTDHSSEARTALDRAHRAALSLEGGELRRALEEARDLLAAGSQQPDVTEHVQAAADKVRRALADLDTGSLMEAERLVEQARLDLGRSVGL